MKHIYAIPGSSSTANFPFDSGCPKCPEFCGEIDGRFTSPVGFANPALLNPQTSVPLKGAMEGAAAGDIIWRNYIPWEHCTRAAAVHVEEVDEGCCPDRRCCSGDPAGMKVSVVAQKFDYAAFCEAGDCYPTDHLIDEPKVIKEITDVAAHDWSKHECKMDVGPGEVLLYGFRIDAMPTDESKLTCLKTQIAVVMTGDSFRHPLQMD